MGCIRNMGKRRWCRCHAAFVCAKPISTVVDMESEEECPPDRNAHVRKSVKQSNCILVPPGTVNTSTHSGDWFKLLGEGLHLYGIDMLVKIMGRWCAGGQNVASVTWNQQHKEIHVSVEQKPTQRSV